ncbi:MAG: hypothetical protein V4631_23605 [Pseudomonadota bacterium]
MWPRGYSCSIHGAMTAYANRGNSFQEIFAFANNMLVYRGSININHAAHFSNCSGAVTGLECMQLEPLAKLPEPAVTS